MPSMRTRETFVCAEQNFGGFQDTSLIHHRSYDHIGVMMGIDTKTYTFDLNLSMSSIKLITKKSSNNAIEVRVHLIQRYWLHEVYTLRKARSEENVAEEFEKKTRIHIQTRN